MTPTSFLKKHEDGILVACGVLFAAAIVALLIWEIGVIAVNIDRAVSIDSRGASALEFNVDAAAKVLQERGIAVPQQ